MDKHLQKVNSKLLLFGEYSILLDAPALAIPFEGFNGHLDFAQASVSRESEESNKIIRKFYDFIKNGSLSDYFQLENFKKDLEDGLFFYSNIPQGYGLGSSGALCAAIAKRYGTKILEVLTLPELKQLFSKLESFFHGKSSGIDPLVIYLNSPLLFEKRDIKKVHIQNTILKANNLSVFILDTLCAGKTSALVEWFTEQLKRKEYKSDLYENYIPLLKSVTKSFLDFDNASFRKGIKEISKHQLKLFTRMIPKEIQALWEEGNTNDNFYLKLCGSGGGGYMLGFTYLNKEELLSVLRNKNEELTYIF